MYHPKHLVERYVRGLKLRVGSKSRLDQAINIEDMKLLMDKMEAAVKM